MDELAVKGQSVKYIWAGRGPQDAFLELGANYIVADVLEENSGNWYYLEGCGKTQYHSDVFEISDTTNMVYDKPLNFKMRFEQKYLKLLEVGKRYTLLEIRDTPGLFESIKIAEFPDVHFPRGVFTFDAEERQIFSKVYSQSGDMGEDFIDDLYAEIEKNESVSVDDCGLMLGEFRIIVEYIPPNAAPKDMFKCKLK